MSVEFGGMGSMVVTMKAVAVTTGGIAGMDGNDTVRNANGGVAPVGVVLNKRNNHAAVQIRGYVRVKYSGSPAPVLGWNRLVTDGAGETGRACLVVNLNTEEKTMGLFL